MEMTQGCGSGEQNKNGYDAVPKQCKKQKAHSVDPVAVGGADHRVAHIRSKPSAFWRMTHIDRCAEFAVTRQIREPIGKTAGPAEGDIFRDVDVFTRNHPSAFR